MASRPTSDPAVSELSSRPEEDGRPSVIRFLDLRGAQISGPREWEPAWVEVDVPVAEWTAAELTRNGVELPLGLRRIGGWPRVVAEWPRSGPGNYRLRLVTGGDAFERSVAVAPAKISGDAFARLLEDLEYRLPVSVALGIQRTGGLAGVALPPPDRTTVEAEYFRLRRAILGAEDRPGLRDLLPALQRDPHRILAATEHWVRRHRARRPHPTRLALAFASGSNLDDEGRLLRVLDTRVEHTCDVYENRLVRTFHRQVESRLRRLVPILAARRAELGAEAASLAEALRRARRTATFLDDVAELSHAPDRVTMVLLRRPEYRAALEAYLEFQRSVAVRLDDDALDAPLENLPYLYQLWGTLVVIHALVDVGARLGYRLAHESIVGRDAGGVYVRVLRDGRTALALQHPEHETTVRLIPERTYGATGALQSITFPQRPDIAIEVQRPGERPEVLLFDPKYKLDGEREGDAAEAAVSAGGPLKVDIDKMHAYRDAIRDSDGRRVVRYAAILYPGPGRRYSAGIEALSADPMAMEGLERRVAEVVEGWLGKGRAEGERRRFPRTCAVKVSSGALSITGD